MEKLQNGAQPGQALAKVFILFAILLGGPVTTRGNDYISGSDVATIGSATAAIGLTGMLVRRIPPGRKPIISGHFPFEVSLQRWLGGDCRVRKSNFLDTKLGAAITPLVSGAILTVANARYGLGDRDKDVAQDLFLFTTGALATKGATDIAKGVFARERPFQHILGDSVRTDSVYGHSYLQHSFFSGHTSGAFFSAGFLNLRLREIMRGRMTGSEYQTWRWISSGVTYGWASFVGLSRVQAYKHHLTDVIVGAAVGILASELFYSFGRKTDVSQSASPPMQLQITISI